MKSGTLGWVVVAGTVIGIDAYLIFNGEETLSEIFGKALNHPVKRWVVLTIWGSVTLHLCSELFNDDITDQLSSIDPIGNIARLLPRKIADVIENYEENPAQEQ